MHHVNYFSIHESSPLCMKNATTFSHYTFCVVDPSDRCTYHLPHIHIFIDDLLCRIPGQAHRYSVLDLEWPSMDLMSKLKHDQCNQEQMWISPDGTMVEELSSQFCCTKTKHYQDCNTLHNQLTTATSTTTLPQQRWVSDLVANCMYKIVMTDLCYEMATSMCSSASNVRVGLKSGVEKLH